MHNSVSVLENGTETFLGFWDSNDHQISTRPRDNPQKKRTSWIMDLAAPTKRKRKDISKRIDKKKKNYGAWKLVIPIVIGAFCTISKGLVQELEDLEIRRVETIQTAVLSRSERIEKSPGDLKRLTVSHIQMSSHQLTLVWKTLKRVTDYRTFV